MSEDWKCPDCLRVNDISKKECFCGKWRPKVVTLKRGDWKCSNCTYLNFASKNKCGKCYYIKQDLSQSSSSSSASQPRPGDWLCSSCKETNFGSRTKCYKCNVQKNGEGMCAVCMENMADSCIKNCGHQVMCTHCAEKIHECPACRQPYISSDIIKIFKLV